MTAEEHLMAGERRARFDFEVDFSNGGGIQGQGFRLDIEGDRIDLSHVVENGMVTYPGLPAPAICDFLSCGQSRARYAPGTEFQIA